MNVALIALPNGEETVMPPLTLAYVAAVLERQRHIVRIYDLALTPDIPFATAFRPLLAFRPQVVVVVSEQLDLLEHAVEVLHSQHTCVIPMHTERSDLVAGRKYSDIMAWVEQQQALQGEKVVISDDHMSVERHPFDLDQLPLPARHLLSLEYYDLRAKGNELQTTLLAGVIRDSEAGGEIQLRTPVQIVAELRSVSREYGIRHYLLSGVILTTDLTWLRELLNRLIEADLEIAWEGMVNTEKLTPQLLGHMAQAGCETLRLDFNVTQVFESAKARARLKQVVADARQHDIHARAELELEPPYEAMPHLVDIAATFGLDDVSFKVRTARSVGDIEMRSIGEDTKLEEVARQRYYAGRSRQQFIDRFGGTLGPLLWKLRTSRIGAALASERGTGGLDEREDLAEPSST